MQKTQRHLTISSRFNGPPGSGNGGISSGLAASLIDGPAEVFLRAPPPLDTPLDVIALDDGSFEIRHGDQLVMTVHPADPLGPPPSAPSFAIAGKGHKSFPSRDTHAFPDCFVCGPDRTEDGLCLFTGHAEGFDGVTDVWTPAADLADENGLVRPEIIWGALDCPGAFAVGFQENPMVLARIVCQIHSRPKAGDTLIVAGWGLYHDGRKHGAITALFDKDGTLLAQSDQLWIELKKPAA
ncbi:hypothetical protein [Hyphomonas pacifica]|uniref:Thioesterase domain-containing protein n=1 Tax=Hyphomonas pacifica TaxID=1280941 RepID=A0A062TY12_9PROT|nr:hypothetical protein [Hyphomonas pacifica]KCZ50917.1 hypothetical protein HY2_12990 [Hyphomonas pacifica]RAN33450.1 hypothetical protein HY3_12930 [Hyphomonas pacifica]